MMGDPTRLCHGDGICSSIGYLFKHRLRPAATSTVYPFGYYSQSSVSGPDTRIHWTGFIDSIETPLP